MILRKDKYDDWINISTYTRFSGSHGSEITSGAGYGDYVIFNSRHRLYGFSCIFPNNIYELGYSKRLVFSRWHVNNKLLSPFKNQLRN